jgi:hypothetical protein
MDILSGNSDWGGNEHSSHQWQNLVESMQSVLIIDIPSKSEAAIARQDSIDAVNALGAIFLESTDTHRFEMRTEASSRVTKLLNEALRTKVDLDLRVVLSSALLAASQGLILTCKFS